MLIDTTSPTFDWRKAYKLFLGFVNPRPIALVSTISPDGRHNLAPYSFFNMVSANPPMVFFSAALSRNREQKHSLINAQATGEFVIATVTEKIAPQMVKCGADLPYSESEFDFSGLTPTAARFVKAPLVEEAAVNIECKLRRVISLGDTPGSGQMVLGEIIAAHIDDAILKPAGDAIDPLKIRTVGRLGEAYYTTVDRAFELHIPGVGGG